MIYCDAVLVVQGTGHSMPAVVGDDAERNSTTMLSVGHTKSKDGEGVRQLGGVTFGRCETNRCESIELLLIRRDKALIKIAKLLCSVHLSAMGVGVWQQRLFGGRSHCDSHVAEPITSRSPGEGHDMSSHRHQDTTRAVRRIESQLTPHVGQTLKSRNAGLHLLPV